MVDEVRMIDANKLLEDIEDAIDVEMDGQDVEKSKFVVLGLKLAGKYIKKAQTIEAQPVNTDKCKALRNIEGIRLILSNVYNTGSTLQDCDYDAIYKRLDVIENILKGK